MPASKARRSRRAVEQALREIDGTINAKAAARMEARREGLGTVLAASKSVRDLDSELNGRGGLFDSKRQVKREAYDTGVLEDPAEGLRRGGCVGAPQTSAVPRFYEMRA
jgi:hypothetical protein